MITYTMKWDDKQLVDRIKNADDKAKRFLRATMEYHARASQAYMRKNATWTDQTSNARNGLIAVTEEHGALWRIVVSHSVSYGIWLEVRWGGRYGIIRPTVNHEGPLVMQTIAQGFAANVFGGS